MSNVLYHSQQFAKVNNISICYDSFGRTDDFPIILIHGLGMQLIAWDPEFCMGLAEKGYHVFRIDNRDVGLSSKINSTEIDILSLTEKNPEKKSEVPYTLKEMAGDAIGLMDYLNRESAIIFGLSMGGMIGQRIALDYPKRVKGLISMMSTTGNPDLPPPTQEAVTILLTQYPPDENGYIESNISVREVLSGYRQPIDKDYVANRARNFYQRGYYPEGVGRQLAAILTSNNRDEELKKLKVPTLVIHGDDDPMVRTECGVHTAKMIPESQLQIIKGLGHDLPPFVWDEVIDLIHNFIQKI